MRLAQIHEYLILLDGGTKTVTATDDECRVWLEYAHRVWPQLEIDSWQAHPRSVSLVTDCQATGHRLGHVTADWENCFLILIVPPGETMPESHILFDIGAEYESLTLLCPTLELDEVVTEPSIANAIHKLPGREDPFAIVDTGRGTYMQTYAEDAGFHIEYQLVSTACHYVLPKLVSAETTIQLFNSYAFGKKEWARNFQWQPMEL